MSTKLNPKESRESKLVDPVNRLAGGYGAFAAKQDPKSLLRRATLTSLLWENVSMYETGDANAKNVADLVPQVAPQDVADIVLECRLKQKLRHMPVFLVREMARHPEHRVLVEDLIPHVFTRVDMMTDFMALYMKDGKVPVAARVRKGLAKAFHNFDEYQFAKYNRDGKVKLRDVMFLTHPEPRNETEEHLYRRIAENTMKTPDTWEVALSGGADKKETFTRLIEERKLGGLALLRNLRNMKESGVDYKVVSEGLARLGRSNSMVLPLNFYSASIHAPEYLREIEQSMLDMYSKIDKLPGHTLFVVDVSGSMGAGISGKSQFRRMDVAAALSMLAAESCERCSVFVTAGLDRVRGHATKEISAFRGFGLCSEIKNQARHMGGGGIFTRQCLEHLKGCYPDADRVIIFSDSQDCDYPDKRIPKTFAPLNYIIDVNSHKHGVNYDGVWTAEISGWSEHFLTFVSALEGNSNSFQDESDI